MSMHMKVTEYKSKHIWTLQIVWSLHFYLEKNEQTCVYYTELMVQMTVLKKHEQKTMQMKHSHGEHRHLSSPSDILLIL